MWEKSRGQNIFLLGSLYFTYRFMVLTLQVSYFEIYMEKIRDLLDGMLYAFCQIVNCFAEEKPKPLS